MIKKITFSAIVVLSTLNYVQAQKPIITDETLGFIEIQNAHIYTKIDWPVFNSYNWLNQFNSQIPTTDWLNDLGVDMKKTQYQYINTNDSIFSYNTILPLSDKNRLEEFILQTDPTKEIIRENNFSYAQLNQKSFIAWNDTFSIISLTSYTKSINEHDYDVYETVDEAAAVVDSVAVLVPPPPPVDEAVVGEIIDAPEDEAVVDAVEAAVAAVEISLPNDSIQSLEEEIQYLKEDIVSNKQLIKEKKKELKELKKHIKNNELVKIQSEIIDSASVYEIDDDYEQYYLKVDSIKHARITNYNLKQAALYFDPSNKTITIPSSCYYKKDSQADAYVWFNQENYYRTIEETIRNSTLFKLIYNPLKQSKNSSNIYLKKDKIEIIGYTYNENKELRKATNKYYNTQFNPKLLPYISTKNLGVATINTDSEAYFDFLYTYFNINNSDIDDKYTNSLKFAFETMKIALDEKAISRIFPGNIVLCLNNLEEAQRKYTSYEYDDKSDDYIQVEKEETILVPNFNISFLTQNESYWTKFFNLLKIQSKTNTLLPDGTFVFDLGEDETIQKLYATTNNDVVSISTSPLQKFNPNNLSKELKENIQKHNSYSTINISDLLFLLQGRMQLDSGEGQIYKRIMEEGKNIDFSIDVEQDESVKTAFNYYLQNDEKLDGSTMHILNLINDIIKHKSSLMEIESDSADIENVEVIE